VDFRDLGVYESRHDSLRGNTAGLIALGFSFVISALVLDQLFELASERVFRWRPVKVAATRAPSSAV
jgi:hypothetical protein